MPTGNELYLDLALRHQIGVRRFASGEVNRLMEILDRANVELVSQLRTQLTKIPTGNFASRRLQELMRNVRGQRDALIRSVQRDFRDEMRKFAVLEEQFEIDMIKEGMPVELSLNRVAPQTLRSLVTSKPFAGGPGAARTMNQWFQGLRRSDQNGITDAIRLGMVQGETVDQMVRRVAGTRARKFTDGVLGVSRRQAEAVVRTGVNHVSNAAREEVWDANADIVEALQWNATLDGRTSAVCRARDGKFTAIGDKELSSTLSKNALSPAGARPPAHPNCRSIMTAIFDSEGIADQIGERPFVRDTRTRRMREKNFRDDAKAKVGAEKWKNLSTEQRAAEISTIRRQWTKTNVGTVPANTTYQQWLKKQPASFQDEVLGKTKGQLFRKGGVKLDKFVDRRGAELNLTQLATKRPATFRRAGIDPVTLRPLVDAPKPSIFVRNTQATTAADVRKWAKGDYEETLKAWKGAGLRVDGGGTTLSPEITGLQRSKTFKGIENGTIRAIASRMASKMRVVFPKANRAALERSIETGLRSWARSSNDNNPISLHMQRMAAKEFDGKLTLWQQLRIDKLGASDKNVTMWSSSKAVLGPGFDEDLATRLFLREMYNDTQAEFKRRGINRVVLHRGTTVDTDTFAKIQTSRSGVAEFINNNVMESWSLSKETASGFSAGAFDVVAQTTVPVERVLSFFGTGFGTLSEWEVVVLNGAATVNRVGIV